MASKSLGTLTVDLVAKIAGFEQGLDRAGRTMDKRMATIERRAKIAGAAIGAGLAAAGVIAARSIKNAIDNADELSKAAQRVGASSEAFSRLAYAGDLADVAISDLQSSMGRLIKAMGDAQSPTSTQARIFGALGISVTDATGKMRDATDVMADFADAFQEQKGSPEVIAAGMEIFGRSFQNLIPLLKDGSAGLREAGEEADALGVTLSTETGRRAEAFNDNLTRLSKAASGLSLQVAGELLPDLESLTNQFVALVTEGDGVSGLAEDISDGFRLIKLGAESSITLVSGVTEVVGGLVTQLQGFYEIAASLATLDFERRDKGAALYRQGGGQVNIGADRLINPHGPNGLFGDSPQATGSYSGPLLAPSQSVADAEFANEVAREKARREHAKKLREALGDLGASPGKAGKSSAAQLAEDASRAADEAARAQYGWNQSILDMTASLAGPAAEAQREYERNISNLNLAFSAGEVELGDYAKAQELYAEQRDRALQAIEATRTPAQRMLEDLALEAELLGKTREEQELLTAARYLGAEAATEQGQAALQALADLQAQAKAAEDQITVLDGARDAARGFLDDLREGEGVWDSLKNAADRFADTLYDLVADKLIEQLFGQAGTTNTGSSGGWLNAVFGAMFGGGKASGGTAMANTIYQVNERGFEMASVNGNDYMLTGNSPVQITPNHALGGVTMNNQFHFAAPTEVRTQQQMASRVGLEVGRAQRRNGGG